MCEASKEIVSFTITILARPALLLSANGAITYANLLGFVPSARARRRGLAHPRRLPTMVDSAPAVSAPVVLLVDRDSDTRMMYADYLRAVRFAIEEADDGREALAKAIAQPPAVIVTETRLPGMDGYDLCRVLRRDDATRHIPIVVVSGDAAPRDRQLALSAGANAVLVKPCLPEELAAELRRVLVDSESLRERARATVARAHEHVATSEVVLQPSERAGENRVFQQRKTTMPPATPPALSCPTCGEPLRYLHSHVGGVSEKHAEQWDYFDCANACGTFQYRQRTRKLRRVT